MKQYKFITIVSLFLLLLPSVLKASLIDDLKSKIDERNSNIKQLEEEIVKYQEQITAIGKEADSLKNTLATLDLSKKKIEADLSVTENKIAATNLEIRELSIQIDDKQNHIVDSRSVISRSLTNIKETEDENSLLEMILAAKSLSSVWNSVDELNILQSNVKDRIHELQNIKANLEGNKKSSEKKKTELVSLEKDLKNQKSVLADTVKEKNSLLAATKNTEANFNRILAQKKAQKDAFEREVLEYESALKIAIDPTKIPHTGTGVLKWPLDTIRITQYFGNTPFATANPQIYNGKGHTGVDFGTSIGTPVHAALDGEVVGVANTDLSPGCYSYGKWIMVRHPNGLSTLYAHLSLQTVAVGDQVYTGQTIGYSGNTGYSTGPHLHFGVYASEGVRITKFTDSRNCRGATIPLADLKAYLNPLSFL